MAFLFVFSSWSCWQFSRIFFDYPLLIEVKEFYNIGLDISDLDLNIISWTKVVSQIIKLRNTVDTFSTHPPQLRSASIDKMDAHNIANRIMRKENYMIALYNKDILNLSIPVFGKRFMLTHIMEWNLWFCIVSYVFDENGAVKTRFLRDSNKYDGY